MFQTPYYVRISRLTGHIYVSDYATDKFTSLSPNGEIIYVLSNESILHSLDFIVDDLDNLLICNSRSKQLEIIYNNGRDRSVLLTTESPYNPGNIAYRKEDGALFVAPQYSRTMFWYQLY